MPWKTIKWSTTSIRNKTDNWFPTLWLNHSWLWWIRVIRKPGNALENHTNNKMRLLRARQATSFLPCASGSARRLLTAAWPTVSTGLAKTTGFTCVVGCDGRYFTTGKATLEHTSGNGRVLPWSSSRTSPTLVWFLTCKFEFDNLNFFNRCKVNPLTITTASFYLLGKGWDRSAPLKPDLAWCDFGSRCNGEWWGSSETRTGL